MAGGMARPRGKFVKGAWRLFYLIKKLSNPVCTAGNVYLAGRLGISRTQICRYLQYLVRHKKIVASTDRCYDKLTHTFFMRRQMALEHPAVAYKKWKTAFDKLTRIYREEQEWHRKFWDGQCEKQIVFQPIHVELIDPLVLLGYRSG